MAEDGYRFSGGAGGAGSGTSVTYPSGTAATVVGRPSVWFDLRDYGAALNGVVVNDAAITAASATLTSATAGFTPADVGKSISVVGAGTSGRNLIGTITARASSTSVTLSVTAATTVAGARITYGTDDTAAVRSAVAAAAAAGGGTIFHPGGLCILAAAPLTGGSGSTAYAGQVLIPLVPVSTAPTMMLRFLGSTPFAQVMWGPQTGNLVQLEARGGSQFISMATSGNVFDVVSDNASGLGYFTNINVVVENLLLRVPQDPQCGGFAFHRALGASFRSCTVGVDAPDYVNIKQPTFGTYGIRLPAVNNGAMVEARSTQVYGWAVGAQHSEHALLDNFNAYSCLVGLEPAAGSHYSQYNRVMLQCNQTHLRSPGQSALIHGSIGTESHTGVEWWRTRYGIDDVNGVLKGRIAYTNYDASGLARLGVRGAKALSISDNSDGALPASMSAVATSDTLLRTNPWALAQSDTGQTWTPVSGTMAQDPNGAYYLSGSDVIGYVNPHAALGSTYTATLTVVVPATGNTNGGLAIHAGGDTIYAAIRRGVVNALSLTKIVGGVHTALGSSTTLTIAASTSYVLSVDVTPTTLTVKIDGTTYISYTLSAGEQTAFSAIKRTGLWFNGAGDNGATRLKNFSVV